MKRNRKKLFAALLLAGILLLALGMGLLLAGYHTGNPLTLGEVGGDILLQIPLDELEEGALYISNDRRAYDGSMRLIVPAAGIDAAVGGSTSPRALRANPGLYEFSQTPGEDGGNVSIAGHRDVHDMVFLHLDRLEAGDLLYLEYGGLVYRYRFAWAKVVPPDDWSVIAPQGFSALTLTTCDPVGTARNRLIVTGELLQVLHSQEGFVFAPNEGAAGSGEVGPEGLPRFEAGSVRRRRDNGIGGNGI